MVVTGRVSLSDPCRLQKQDRSKNILVNNAFSQIRIYSCFRKAPHSYTAPVVSKQFLFFQDDKWQVFFLPGFISFEATPHLEVHKSPVICAHSVQSLRNKKKDVLYIASGVHAGMHAGMYASMYAGVCGACTVPALGKSETQKAEARSEKAKANNN